MSAENISENMSTDLPDILCRNNPDYLLSLFHRPSNSFFTPL